MGWWVHPPLPFSPRKSPPVHEYSSDPALHFNLASCSGGIKNVSWRLVLFWLESRRLAGRAVGRLVMLSCHRGLTVVSPWSHRGLPLFLRTSIQSSPASSDPTSDSSRLWPPSLHTGPGGSCRHQYSTATSPPWPTGARLLRIHGES